MSNQIHNQNNRPVGATFRKDAVDTPPSGAAIIDMKLIPLSDKHRDAINKGKYSAMVDDEDYDWLMSFSWTANPRSYTTYAIRKSIFYSMHRLILGITDPKIEVDHIDGNGLNNQRSNLRVCTSQQNSHNQKKRRGAKYKYKGVRPYRAPKNRAPKWRAAIYISRKYVHLGTFETEEAAARAYDEAAKKQYGSFARLNFP